MFLVFYNTVKGESWDKPKRMFFCKAYGEIKYRLITPHSCDVYVLRGQRTRGVRARW